MVWLNEEVKIPNYELAESDYMDGMKYKDIADKYKVTINTVKSWKTRYEWSKDKKKSTRTKKKKVCTQKVGAPIGNKNAIGNSGGSAPHENKNAERHGFFTKWLPEETLEIMQHIQNSNPIDLLWDNIMLQYTAIIRAQKIMHVTEKSEMIKELKKSKIKTTNRETEKTNSNTQEEEFEYEFQFSWDRQSTFMNAQSRAMGELRSMIKQYEELCKSSMATELQKNRIMLLKAQVDKLSGTDDLEELSKLDKVLAEIKGVV